MTLPTRKFQAHRENFVCAHCGAEILGSGFTNHCPQCLWSKHVDVNPGDRAEGCGGMMEPAELEFLGGAYRILHRCVVCGYEKRNQSARSDNQDELARLSTQGAL